MQVFTLESDYADVTVWREDDGEYCVQCQRWPHGDSCCEDENGDFPPPASNHFSIKMIAETDAQQCAEHWFHCANVAGPIDAFLADDELVDRTATQTRGATQ
jgi:hypothetical protein